MIPEAREVHLSNKDRKVLEACCRSPMTLQRDLKRARIVLLAAVGRSTRSIAKEVGVQPRIVSLWRHRYARKTNIGSKYTPMCIFTSRRPARPGCRGMVLDLARAVAQRRLLHKPSLQQLQEHIDAYIEAYNDRAEPF